MIGENASRPASGVTLDNWQTAPQLSWSFQHIADLFPTAAIPRGSGPVRTLPAGLSPVDDIPVVLGTTLVITIATVIGSLLADILCSFTTAPVRPRARSWAARTPTGGWSCTAVSCSPRST